MAGPNDFTNQNIQDTYQRLLQVSSSGQVTDGTGSLVELLDVTASYAVSASHEITYELSSSYSETSDLAANATSASYALSSSVATRTNESLTVGTGLDLNSGVNWNGLYNRTINLDLTEVITDDGANRLLTTDGDGTLTAESQFLVTGTEATLNGNLFVSTSVQTPILKGDENHDTGLKITGYLWTEGTNGHITASGDISSSGTITAEQLTTSDDLNIGGDLTAVTNITLGNDLNLANNSAIVSSNQSTTNITLNNDDYWKFNANGAYVAAFASNGATFNENGGSLGFRVESSNDEYALYINGGDDTIELGRLPNTHVTASGNISASGDIIATGTGSFSDGRFTGKVGIGTTSPDDKLHVSGGNIRLTANAATEAILSLHPNNGNAVDKWQISAAADGSNLSFSNKSTGAMVSTMYLKDDGNVGIGTTSPGNKLEVNSGTTNVAGVFKSSDNQAWISVQDDDSGTYGALFGTDSDAGHHIVLADRSANKRLVVDSSGNVGIGTTSPEEKLTVKDGYIAVTGSSTSHGYKLHRDGYDSYSLRHLDGGLTIYNIDDNEKEMTFDGTGNVGIGNSNPTEKLTVSGSISSSGAISTLSHITASGNISSIGTISATTASIDKLVITDHNIQGRRHILWNSGLYINDSNGLDVNAGYFGSSLANTPSNWNDTTDDAFDSSAGTFVEQVNITEDQHGSQCFFAPFAVSRIEALSSWRTAGTGADEGFWCGVWTGSAGNRLGLGDGITDPFATGDATGSAHNSNKYIGWVTGSKHVHNNAGNWIGHNIDIDYTFATPLPAFTQIFFGHGTTEASSVGQKNTRGHLTLMVYEA